MPQRFGCRTNIQTGYGRSKFRQFEITAQEVQLASHPLEHLVDIGAFLGTYSKMREFVDSV
jgi:hypothetical protein